ncbi:MAG: alpha/beta hydrolase [Sphaerochaeta sp.]|nr:alpha/beta hydrolase [Sphaerochaeta sp.]
MEKVGFITMIILFLIVLAMSAYLIAISPGKPIPLRGHDGKTIAGSLSEKVFIEVQGIRQGMFIQSTNTDNPVLLFLHGGPGMPEYFLTRDYPTGLEEDFTVCWWDQRGAGLSYDTSIPPETMTAEQYVKDTIAITNYLRDRFCKGKIYLMGHSWGSYIGLLTARAAPELYHAYIAIAQISHQLASENLTYQYMLEKYREQNNYPMVRKLEKSPVTMTLPLPEPYMRIRDKAMHNLGIGTTHDMKSVIRGIFIASLLNREYTIQEKVHIWRGKKFSKSFHLWDTMQAMDFSYELTEVRMPVYFLHGIYDHTVSFTEAKSYFEKLKAPTKGFYSFEHSAHSPIFEEPDKVRHILTENVLLGITPLAD